MNRDAHFAPPEDALIAALHRLRANPPGLLSGLVPLVAELEDSAGGCQDATGLLDELAAHPLAYTPEIDPVPPDLMPTTVRGLRLLLALADELSDLDDATALELLRALYDHAEFLYCFNVTRHPHVRALNGAFLALTGFYLDGFDTA